MGDIDRQYRQADAVELAGLVRAGEVHATKLAEAAIRMIEALNPRPNAVVDRRYDIGRGAAAAVERGAVLAGVPFLLKDLALSWAGVKAPNASRFLKDYLAAADSHAVGRIKAAGLSMLGVTNAPENGWSIATEPALYGPALNPWSADVTPGGSSGGAASAVAAGMVPLAEGYYDMSMTDLAAYNALWADAMFLFPFNISGQPAMSLPLAQFASGVPLGIQIIGRQGEEGLLLAVARILEQAMPWQNRHPPVSVWAGQGGERHGA